MMVRVLLFAAAREAAGRDAVEVDLPGDAATPAAVLAALAAGAGGPALARVAARARLAVNHVFAAPGAPPIRPGDEVALIPPVGGG